jgi:hypothetical protein
VPGLNIDLIARAFDAAKPPLTPMSMFPARTALPAQFDACAAYLLTGAAEPAEVEQVNRSCVAAE